MEIDARNYKQMSFIWEMEEEKDFIHLESETYPSIALVADIGGAMGLFLGLSIIARDFTYLKF